MAQLTLIVANAAALAILSGCSTAQKLSDAQLESLGIRVGTTHWEATQQLNREGYICSVAGAKRESFDCTKTTGLFPTCVLRVRLTVDDQNKISLVSVSDPACIGTP